MPSFRWAFPALLMCAPPAWAGGVTVLFDPSDPATGPFPTDFLTVADPAQKTGRRINLPLPDCAAQPSACQELRLVNELDGFNIQPRVRVKFSAPVNPDTLRDGIYIVWLDNLTADETGLEPAGHVTPLNQVVFDPATQTAYGKSDEVLGQHRRYALVVTNAIRDAAGDPVEVDGPFLACATVPTSNEYCTRLAPMFTDLAARVAPRRVVAASIFTTMSTTAWMEKARAVIQSSSLSLTATGPTSVFRVSEISSIVWSAQTLVNPPAFRNQTLPLNLLAGVGRIAFGSFRSPSFLDDHQVIPGAPTGAAVALPAASDEISFQVYLPDAPMPATGYPVVIFGHGLGDSRFGGPTAVASTLAQRGFAIIAINAVGHGFGPQGKLTITRSGAAVEVPAPGRGVDANGDGIIDSSEGCVQLDGPYAIRDCLRQTALDLMQLVRAIRTGIDLDGDGVVDLNGGRIYYAGQSLGSFYGTILNGVEPGIAAAVLNVGGASVVETARWSPSFQPLVVAELALRRPSLLNRGFGYDENYVLRDRPAKVNTVSGAIDIQNFLETIEWIEGPGNPAAYAPHLRASPLGSATPKPVLFQFALGDRTVPNPANSNLIRSAGLYGAAKELGRSRQFPGSTRRFVSLYRHDLARAAVPQLDQNPHGFLAGVISIPPAAVIAIAAQQQIAGFFASGGASVPDVNSLVRPMFTQNLFEAPDFVTSDLNF